MLHELAISGLGVIDTARLTLRPGLTVLTGETGAGKTMVLTGLNLILGGKANADTVRVGAQEAVAEAVLDLPPDSEAAAAVQEAGALLDDDGTLTVTRIVGATTRSRAVLGGRTVPQALLAEVAAHTVTVHGQQDQVRLRTASRQRETLDDYAGAEHQLTLARYRTTWRDFHEAREQLETMRAGAGNSREEAARLREALEAIAAVEPLDGEDEDLAAQANLLDNLQEVRVGLATAHDALMGEEGMTALAALEAARRALADVARHDARIGALVDRAAEYAYGVSDLATDVAGYLDSAEGDPGRLEAIHARRAELAALSRRLGVPLAQIPEFSAAAARTVAGDDMWDERLAQCEARTRELASQLEELAATLSATRHDAADRLATRVQEELQTLAMPDADFRVTVESAELGPHGADAVSMLLAAHPGATPRPVAEAASGGELSRIMLAIEVALADGHAPAGVRRTFVFDEVDAGVGGRAALAVGARLAALARTHQVIVVTHLAQVAAYASAHVVVHKSTDGSVTVSAVREVDGEDRVSEIARLLSGHEDSDTARAHALELLEAASVAP